MRLVEKHLRCSLPSLVLLRLAFYFVCCYPLFKVQFEPRQNSWWESCSGVNWFVSARAWGNWQRCLQTPLSAELSQSLKARTSNQLVMTSPVAKGRYTPCAIFSARLIRTKIYFFKLLFVLLVNPHRTRILHGRKANLLFFESRFFFPNIRPANKHISQSRWLCGADIMSVSSNNNINNNSWQAYLPCLSAPGVVW